MSDLENPILTFPISQYSHCWTLQIRIKWKKTCEIAAKCWVKLMYTLYNNLIVKLSQSVNMSFTQHFAAISQVFSDCMHICSFQQCQYCEIGNVSMGFSKSLMPKILYKSLVFDSWFDKIFGICDLENPILTFPPHSIVSLLS